MVIGGQIMYSVAQGEGEREIARVASPNPWTGLNCELEQESVKHGYSIRASERDKPSFQVII